MITGLLSDRFLGVYSEFVEKKAAELSTVHLGNNDISFPQSQIAISKLSIIDSMRSNRNKEDIVVSRIVITRVDCIALGGKMEESGFGRETRGER